MEIGKIGPVTLSPGAVSLSIAKAVAQAGATQGAGGGAPWDAVDRYITEQMRRLHMPGVALAVVEGDRIVHLHGFGHARPGGEPPSAQTTFAVCSITKSLTALAVMQLAEAGRIELDAPVQRYLPWFRVADAQASAAITVRHLLHQTSGLPEWPGLLLLADCDESPGAAERQARALSTLALARPVGSAFEYSNLNFNLLGLIVEAVSGMSYAQWVEQHIFAPLEMSHSYTAQTEARKHDLATGHRYWFGIPFAAPELPIPRGSLASGQLFSCAEDLAHYLIAHLNGGRYRDAQIISGAGMAELHRGGPEYRKLGILVGTYAMGWFVTQHGPTSTLWHTGTVPDFSAYMAILPEQNRGIVLLCNADHHMMMPVLAEVGMGATDLIAGRPRSPQHFGLVYWALRALPLIALLQILGVIRTQRQIKRWRLQSAFAPQGGRERSAHLLLPLISNLLLAAAPACLRVGSRHRYMALFMPDILWTAVACGTFAGVWSVLRTVLILRGASVPRPPTA